MYLWAFTRHLFLFSQNCNRRFFLLFKNIEFWHFRAQKFRANSTLQQSFCGRISAISSSKVAKSILYISKTLLLVPALRYTIFFILLNCVFFCFIFNAKNCFYPITKNEKVFIIIDVENQAFMLAFSTSRAMGKRDSCCDKLTPF